MTSTLDDKEDLPVNVLVEEELPENILTKQVLPT